MMPSQFCLIDRCYLYNLSAFLMKNYNYSVTVDSYSLECLILAEQWMFFFYPLWPYKSILQIMNINSHTLIILLSYTYSQQHQCPGFGHVPIPCHVCIIVSVSVQHTQRYYIDAEILSAQINNIGLVRLYYVSMLIYSQ